MKKVGGHAQQEIFVLKASIWDYMLGANNPQQTNLQSIFYYFFCLYFFISFKNFGSEAKDSQKSDLNKLY